MKIKQIEVFTIHELSPEAKEKALQKWVEGNDYYFLEDSLNEVLHELLKENGIKDTNDTSKTGTKPTRVHYSLSCCQGDGCMFAGEFIWKDYLVYIKHSGQYYHSNSKFIEILENNDEQELASDEVHDDFEKIYQKICGELETYGYRYIEHEDSMETFIDACDSNEYMFTIDGKMENI